MEDIPSSEYSKITVEGIGYGKKVSKASPFDDKGLVSRHSHETSLVMQIDTPGIQG